MGGRAGVSNFGGDEAMPAGQFRATPLATALATQQATPLETNLSGDEAMLAGQFRATPLATTLATPQATPLATNLGGDETSPDP